MNVLCLLFLIVLIIISFRLLSAFKKLAKKEEEHFKQLEKRIAILQKNAYFGPQGTPEQTTDTKVQDVHPPMPSPEVIKPQESPLIQQETSPAAQADGIDVKPIQPHVPAPDRIDTPPVSTPAAPMTSNATTPSNTVSTPAKSNRKSTPTFMDGINNKLRQQTETIEGRTKQVLGKIWQWIVVGEEYRNGNVSKEYAVATTWLLRAAVLLIVFGISYFIKYSHDKNLLSPEIRLAVASFFALVLLASGCRLLHGKYRMIGIALSGCGFAGLYLCVYAAVGIYHLVPPLVGLGCMVVLTIAGVLLALRLDTLLLAVFALTGGYLAPILMSSGSHDLVGFFSYLLILTAGSLFIARYRSWTFLNILSFVAVWLLYYVSDPFQGANGYTAPTFHYLVGILFGFAFFLAFSIQSVIFNLFTSRKITLIEIIMTALNLILFLAPALEETLERYGREYAAGLTFLLAIFFLLQITLLRCSGMKDKILMLTLLVFSSGLVALTLPLILQRDYWSAAWSIQAIAMLYIACRAQSRGLAVLSYIVFLVAGIRLMAFDFAGAYFHSRMNFLDRIADFGSYTLALIGGYFTLKRYPLPLNPAPATSSPDSDSSDKPFMMKVLFWCGFIVSFILFFGECHHIHAAPFRFFGMTLVSSVYLVLLVGLVVLFHGTGKVANAVLAFVLLIFWTFTIYMFIDRFHADESLSAGFYILRIAEYVLLTGILLAVGRINLFHASPDRRVEKLFLVSALCFWFLYSSAELRTLSIEYGWKAGGKVAVSALWGFYAFLLLLYGIRKSHRTPRYIALALFAVTVIKIFILDLAQSAAIYRIGGCLAVGVILVASAWIYMKSGRVPVEKPAPTTNPDTPDTNKE